MIELYWILGSCFVGILVCFLGILNANSSVSMSRLFPKHHWKVIDNYIQGILKVSLAVTFFSFVNFLWVIMGGSL
jgi:hypothetical protein